MAFLSGEGDRFAVVDVETTGVYNSDRIVEIAVVTLSPNGRVIDEWDTLVNPERDVGPTHIHRVTASMVSAAPLFSEVSAAVAERLDGALLVAHNLSFDSRMIANEFERAGGELEPGHGVCTLRLTNEKLAIACSRRGIPLTHHHRALADARATVRLFRDSVAETVSSDFRPALVRLDSARFSPRTMRRDLTDEPETEMPYLARLADRAHHYGEHGPDLIYMDLLDVAISDLVITRDEQNQLTELAMDLGLTMDEVHAAHTRYLDELIAAALRDGTVDHTEEAILTAAARELRIDAAYVAARIEGYTATAECLVLREGLRVCFTGTATYPDGSQLPRSVLESMARDQGLVPVKNVTKKKCDVLIASDPSSQSGKANKARQFGIPVVAVADYLIAPANGSVTTVA